MTLESLKLAAALPEILLLVLLSVVLLIDLFMQRAERVVHGLSVGGLLLIGLWQLMDSGQTQTVYAMNNLVVADSMTAFLKGGAALAAAITLLYSRHYIVDREIPNGEFHVLAMFALLGQFVMISANSFLTIYLGIELLSLALYALVALRRNHAISTEAAMKYFVLGALASGFLLYGMSMIYGATGTLDLPLVADKLASGQADRLIMVFGTVFLVAGLAFKLGAVPFHMWVPDVYQGAPTAMTLLIGAAPKFAAFAITIRLLVSGLIGVAADWQQMLMILAVLSLGVGNLIAIMQTNVKRLLAYSTIAHMGFMLLGFASGVVDSDTVGAVDAYAASLFYVVTYVITTLGSFGVLMLASSKGFECESLDDIKGLGRRHPWLAAIFLILIFSLAGIPPTVGFYAKLAVLEAVVQAGHIALAVFAVMASLVGAFYYLRLVKVMYFDESKIESPMDCGRTAQSLLAANGIVVLLLGILPGPLMAVCLYTVRVSLAA
ncbi:MAG: NADH-quinone oxidoreductase subunit NuoN [Burkholderiaceae bacterium]|nr:NADH-quinone oxidoreductase subunit NuoN [Burkholderiaceae bacterium]